MTQLFHWLENHALADDRRAVFIRGDFFIHNMLIQNGQVTAILDSECFDFGGPGQYLAYIRPHISKHMEYKDFLEDYMGKGGQDICEGNVSFAWYMVC